MKIQLNKPLITAASFTVLLTLTFTKCYYDSEEYLYPEINSQCDTSNVTFSGSVKPVLSDKCFLCHSNSAVDAGEGGGIKLENYTDVKARIDDGSLLGSIKQDGTASPMPQNSAKLDNCTISIIQKWADNNAPDN